MSHAANLRDWWKDGELERSLSLDMLRSKLSDRDRTAPGRPARVVGAADRVVKTWKSRFRKTMQEKMELVNLFRSRKPKSPPNWVLLSK